MPAGKRDLHIRQKKPTYKAKETYIKGKRDLHLRQKRGKRDLQKA